MDTFTFVFLLVKIIHIVLFVAYLYLSIMFSSFVRVFGFGGELQNKFLEHLLLEKPISFNKK